MLQICFQLLVFKYRVCAGGNIVTERGERWGKGIREVRKIEKRKEIKEQRTLDYKENEYL